MKSSIQTLENNKVKVSVDLDENEFEKDLDEAFKRIAQDVKLPGFREGKVPRKVLEARIGQQHARDEAFRSALPTYYSEAVIEHDVDVIAAPEFDITAGQEGGTVSFDAVVETRPDIEVSGYENLEIEISSIEVEDEDIDNALDAMRQQGAQLNKVDRAAQNKDRVSIDIETTHDGEAVPGFTTEGYIYEVGSGSVVPEIDENLVGAVAGDEVSFDAKHPEDEDGEPLKISLKVNEVQEEVLPEATDEWAAENSDFETVDALREDLSKKIAVDKINQANTTLRIKLSEAIADLVEDDLVPEALVNLEADNRLQDMAMRLQQQGIGFEQYLEWTGQTQETVLNEVKDTATGGAKMDLALRAIAKAENIQLSDDELDEELAKVGDQLDKSTNEVREEFVKVGQMSALKADLLKSKTLDWLTAKAKLVDDNGRQVSPDALEIEEEQNS